MAVQLTEVALILCLADNEVPVERCGLTIGALHGDLHIDTAVCHVLIGGIAYLAVCDSRLDGGAVHGHLDRGINACVYDGRTDGRALFAACLRTSLGHRVNDGRVVLDLDLDCAVDGDVLVVRTLDGDSELIAGDKSVRDADGVGAVLVLGNAKWGAVTQPCFYVTTDAEGGVYGEIQLVVLTDICREHCAKVEGGRIHDAVHDGAAHRRVEVKRIDGVVGDIVHGVHLEAVIVVLQPLAVLVVELCRAAFHLKAADTAGAGANQPIGVFACGLSIEGVVAGAVCAQVAVGLVVETVVVAVFLNGEHDCTVCAGGLAVLNGGGCLEYRRAFGVAVLSGEDRCGVGVIDNNFAAGLGETAGGLVGAAYRDKLQSVETIVGFFISKGGELLEAPGAVDKPLNIIGGAVGVNEVEAAVGLGFFHLPGVIDLVQGQTIVVCVHGQLLAVGSGDGVDAIGGADRPNQVCGGICNLAVCHGDILTDTVVFAGRIC